MTMKLFPSIPTLSLAFFAVGATAATPIDETRALEPTAQVSLDNVKGRIDVDTWDRAEIRIRGTLGSGTEGLDVEGDAGKLSVRVKYPNGNGWFGGWGGKGAEDSELLVTLPVGVSLDIDAVSARVSVRGVAGARLGIDSVSGDVDVDSGASDIEIDTVSGGQRVTARGTDVALESVSGDIDLRGDISGRIELEAVSGGLRVQSGARARLVSAGVVSGDIELRVGLQPGGRITAESLSGDLEVVVPVDTSAKVSASSFTGTIRSEQGKVETEEHGPGSSLEVTLGTGDGRIELETFSGDLGLRSE
jgi:DUF4097 and DUF4098 domain-containing protein YvlB